MAKKTKVVDEKNEEIVGGDNGKYNIIQKEAIELMGGRDKKFNFVSLYTRLKIKGLYSNPNELLEDMIKFEKDGLLINVAGLSWAIK